MKNIVLIGMPGAGKSTVGVVLAKVIGYKFIDADLLIQEREGRLLSTIIKEDGLERFIEIENEVNCGIQGEKSVIATGGSVIYGKEAMEHLRKIGQIIYLRLPYEVLNSRLHNIKGRGVALKEGQTLKDLYEERCPLYEKYAHFILDTENLDVEETISEIEKLTKN
jgi:shikimate kinase